MVTRGRDHPARGGRRYRDIVSIFFPRVARDTHAARGREKNKVISERKHVKSIAAPGSNGTLRLSLSLSLSPLGELRGKVTTTRGNTAATRRGQTTREEGDERIGKVEIAPAKLLSRNGLPRNFRRRPLSWALRFYRAGAEWPCNRGNRRR